MRHILLIFTYKQLLLSRIHIGEKFEQNWTGSLTTMIYGFQHSFYFLNLKFTILNLKNSLYYLNSVVFNRLTLFFVNQDFLLQDRIVSEFTKFLNFGFYYIHYKWIGGFVSNFKYFATFFYPLLFFKSRNVIKGNLNEKYKWMLYYLKYRGLCFCHVVPSFILNLNASFNCWSITEGVNVSIPTFSIVNLDCNFLHFITYKIPGNSVSKISLLWYIQVIKNSFILSFLSRFKFIFFLIILNVRFLKKLKKVNKWKDFILNIKFLLIVFKDLI